MILLTHRTLTATNGRPLLRLLLLIRIGASVVDHATASHAPASSHASSELCGCRTARSLLTLNGMATRCRIVHLVKGAHWPATLFLLLLLLMMELLTTCRLACRVRGTVEHSIKILGCCTWPRALV